MVITRLPEKTSRDVVKIPERKFYIMIFLRYSTCLNKWAYIVMTCDKDQKVKAQLSATSLKFLNKKSCLKAARIRTKQCVQWYSEKHNLELGEIFVKEM